MSERTENEGFRMMEDFVCDAIHDSGIPQADPTKPGKNEGMRLVEELVFEGANGSQSIPQRRSDVCSADLVAESREWNKGRGITLESWIGYVGNFEHAIGYGELFWPEFTEYDGCVLFAGFSEKSYRGFMQQTGGNRQAVEAVMNHRHILDLFCGPALQPTREQLVYLGRLLKEMWTAKLQRDFPGRRIAISFPDEPCDDLDYEITFFQE